MSASTVPTVLAALTATVTAGSAGVQVISGQPLNNLQQDFIAVGWNGQASAVDMAVALSSASAASQEENYDLHSQIVSWRGAADQASDVLARVFTIFDAVQNALSVDPRLGETCALAQITMGSYTPAQTDKGPMGLLVFTVRVKAFKS